MRFEDRTANGGQSPAFIVLVTFLVFSYPLYASNLLPMRLTFVFFCAGAFLVLASYVRRDLFSPRDLGSLSLWILAAFVAILSFAASQHNYDYSRVFYPVCLVISIACALVSSSLNGWIMTTLKTLVVMLIPFALGTIFLYFFQDTYPLVKSILFPDSIFATGYKSGLTTHYSHNGTYCITGFLISLGLALYSSGAKKERRGWLIAGALFLFALLLIGKRQTLLFGGFAVVFVYLFSNDKNKGKKLLCAAILIIVIGALIAQVVPGVAESLERLFNSFGDDDIASVTNGRDVVWETAIAGWSESILFGKGWGTFTYQFTGTNTVHVAHNELLDLLYGVGLVGALVFVVCSLATLVISIRLFRKSYQDESASRISHMSTALSISLMLQVYNISMSFTIGSLFATPSAFMPYFLAVSIVAYCYRLASKKSPKMEHPWYHARCRLI